MVTERLVELLRSEGVVPQVLNVSPGDSSGPIRYHAMRVVRHLRAMGSLFGRTGPAPRLYLSMPGGAGVAYLIPMAVLARVRGYRVVAHHHSFAYLNSHSRLHRWAFRAAGSECYHVVLCQRMRSLLVEQYPSPSNVLVCSNAELIPAVVRRRRDEDEALSRGLNIGHFSNLSLEKGLDVVVGLLRELLSRETDVTLHLGGLPVDEAASRALADAQVEFGGRLVYWGHLDGDRKSEFLSVLDVFLFPSRYSHEAEPLVILEAMSAGVPVIGSDAGCLAERLGPFAISMSDADRWIVDAASLLGRRDIEDSLCLEMRIGEGKERLLAALVGD